MRSYVALALLAVVAAPALARPIEPAAAAGSEAVNWKKVGDIAGDVGKGVLDVLKFFKREDQQLLARAIENELYMRTVPAAAAGSEAVNWKKVGDIAGDVGKGVLDVLKFLKREDQEMLARAFGDELYARDDNQLYARAFDDGLYVRTVPASAAGSEAVNWKKVGDIAGDVGKGVFDVLKFFKREDRQLLARAIENELYMRTVPAAAAGSEAVNWKKVGDIAGDVGKGVLDVLKFLKREDPLLAREFQAELYARGFDEDALLARSFGEDELYARSFDDELYARTVPAAAVGSEAVNWKKVGHVAGDVGKGLLDVLKFLRRDGMEIDMLD